MAVGFLAFMEDGALPLQADTTYQWHRRHFIKHVCIFSWPRIGPDISQNESLLSQVKQIQSRERATSMAGLKRIKLKVWRKIPPSCLQSLYKSMPRRMRAVVEAQGGHANYQVRYRYVNCTILSKKHSLIKNAINFFPR